MLEKINRTLMWLVGAVIVIFMGILASAALSILTGCAPKEVIAPSEIYYDAYMRGKKDGHNDCAFYRKQFEEALKVPTPICKENQNDRKRQ